MWFLYHSMCCSFAAAGTDGCLSSQFVSAEIDNCAWICDKHVQTAKKNFNLRSKIPAKNNSSMDNGGPFQLEDIGRESTKEKPLDVCWSHGIGVPANSSFLEAKHS